MQGFDVHEGVCWRGLPGLLNPVSKMAMQPRSRRVSAGSDESETQPPKRSLRELRRLGGFLRPYRLAIAGAVLALTIAAATVLVIGQGLRRLVDDGFAAGNTGLLDDALVALLVVVVVLAGATYSRFFLVSWIGERVMADLRKAVSMVSSKRCPFSSASSRHIFTLLARPIIRPSSMARCL